MHGDRVFERACDLPLGAARADVSAAVPGLRWLRGLGRFAQPPVTFGCTGDIGRVSLLSACLPLDGDPGVRHLAARSCPRPVICLAAGLSGFHNSIALRQLGPLPCVGAVGRFGSDRSPCCRHALGAGLDGGPEGARDRQRCRANGLGKLDLAAAVMGLAERWHSRRSGAGTGACRQVGDAVRQRGSRRAQTDGCEERLDE
jgi:hypothetical protein